MSFAEYSSLLEHEVSNAEREAEALEVEIPDRVPPCRISAVGLHHPLREPYVPLSEYTALSLFGQYSLTDYVSHGGTFHTPQAFSGV